jgi:hypothetical protein
MKFSDNIIRRNLDVVHVIRTTSEMEAREEFNSNFWDIERENILNGKNLYSTPARDVKIGESIFTKNAKYIAYRVE